MTDIETTRGALAQDRTTAGALLEQSLARAAASQHVYTRLDAAGAREQLQRLQSRGEPVDRLPLAGLAITVKDLFDVAGQVTTAGSRLLGPDGIDAPPATADGPAVARLRQAGGVLFGRTNMSEFAFSGVGINPHFGTPANPADPIVARVPGGSSSGAAVSVADGSAWVGLGSDTGGSIRIPAALCGIVGFKSTARLVPTEGAFPLSTTLDTVGALTRSVRDAIRVHEILAQRTVVKSSVPLAHVRLAVVRHTLLDDLDATVSRAFERALRTLSTQGARIEEIELPALGEIPAQLPKGTLTAAECHAIHRGWIAQHPDWYDPRVLARIRRGETMLAADYVDLLNWRADWMRRVEQALAGFDAAVSPTVPMVAPPIADLAPGASRDEAFFRANGLLLRNTSVMNLLDGCAISLPCHDPSLGELPVGLMLWHGALHDDAVLHAALHAEQALARAVT